jgi:hypothetical protein
MNYPHYSLEQPNPDNRALLSNLMVKALREKPNGKLVGLAGKLLSEPMRARSGGCCQIR